MKRIAALLCMALVIGPSFGSAAGLKHPINVDVEHVARTLKAADRIAYGQVASKGQFQFMARLAWSSPDGDYTACGGTVLSSMYILTAAHCMFDTSTALYPPTSILLGGTDMSNWNSFAERIPVAQVYVHPKYIPGYASSNYDVAIVKLKTPTSFPAVNLATVDPPASTSLTSIGWGLTDKSASGVDNSVLLYTTLKVGTFGVGACPSSCGQNPCTILCELGVPAGGNGFTSACQGDSGGPQVLQGTTTQVSIVSFGPEGCGTDPWGASTSVAAVKSWIDSILSGMPTPTPTPSPSPTPTPTPTPTPSPTPTPIPTPIPTPTPTPTSCPLDTSKGVNVQISFKAAACSNDASKAAAIAAAQSSGATSYCVNAYKCKAGSGKILISGKISVNNDRAKAKKAIDKAFTSGTFYARFAKILTPTVAKKYIPQYGSSCVYPAKAGSTCVY